MKNDLVFLFRAVNNFGLFAAVFLLARFKFGRYEKLSLASVKHPIYLRKNTSDAPTFEQVFVKNEYKAAYPDEAKIIIDAGANIGLFLVYMKNRFPDSKIIAIEPDPENFEQLKKNTGLYDNIHYENCGLWSHSTDLKVYDKFNMGKWGLVVEEATADSNVKATCMADIMERYGLNYIDILKVDIETSEKQVFLKGYEDWLPKVKMVVIELHDWVADGCSKTFFEAINCSFSSYEYAMRGDNTIIINKSVF